MEEKNAREKKKKVVSAGMISVTRPAGGSRRIPSQGSTFDHITAVSAARGERLHLQEWGEGGGCSRDRSLPACLSERLAASQAH